MWTLSPRSTECTPLHRSVISMFYLEDCFFNCCWCLPDVANFLPNFPKNSKSLQNFDTKTEIAELCKGVHSVDLGESFPTHIYLQNFVSMQPRTSPLKSWPRRCRASRRAVARPGGPARADCPRSNRALPRIAISVPIEYRSDEKLRCCRTSWKILQNI